MHLMYTLDANGKRIYTLKKVQAGEVTASAHPARFSPDDKYSRYAIHLLKSHGHDGCWTWNGNEGLHIFFKERRGEGRSEGVVRWKG